MYVSHDICKPLKKIREEYHCDKCTQRLTYHNTHRVLDDYQLCDECFFTFQALLYKQMRKMMQKFVKAT